MRFGVLKGRALASPAASGHENQSGTVEVQLFGTCQFGSEKNGEKT